MRFCRCHFPVLVFEFLPPSKKIESEHMTCFESFCSKKKIQQQTSKAETVRPRTGISSLFLQFYLPNCTMYHQAVFSRHCACSCTFSYVDKSKCLEILDVLIHPAVHISFSKQMSAEAKNAMRAYSKL